MVTTLAFVAPDAVKPKVIDKIRTDLKADDVQSLTDDDLTIWATHEGQTYVDVLASKKEDAPVKKGKGYKDAQWEAEVRKSLANKNKSASLSKQDCAFIQAQLEKEADIRQRIAGLKAQLEQGVHLVRSLVAAQVEQVKEFVSDLGALLREDAFGKAVTLAGEASFETYLVSVQSVIEICVAS